MNAEVQQLYVQTVRQWPAQERLRLAALILGELADPAPVAQARPPLSPEQRQAALAELLRHAGAVRSGNPRSADNEQIDADLVREYGKDL